MCCSRADAAIRQVDRQRARARWRRRASASRGQHAAPPRQPVARAHDHADDREHHRGEHDEIAGRVGQRAPAQRRAASAARRDPSRSRPIGRQQRHRQAIDVDALHVREPRQRVRVEREQPSPRSEAGRERAGPAPRRAGTSRTPSARSRRSGRGCRRAPASAPAHAIGAPINAGTIERLGERQRVVRRIEDVGVEQVQRDRAAADARPTPGSTRSAARRRCRCANSAPGAAPAATYAARRAARRSRRPPRGVTRNIGAPIMPQRRVASPRRDSAMPTTRLPVSRGATGRNPLH